MRRSASIHALIVALTLALGVPGAALAEGNDELLCPPEAPELDRFQLLRSMSLDLRGDLPTVDELAALKDADDVPEQLVRDWLESEAFTERFVRRHRDLLWPNLDMVRLFSNSIRLRRDNVTIDGQATQIYWQRNRADDFRGVLERCLLQPAEFGPDGRPIAYDVGEGGRKEGYVEVTPYWAPDTTIKVCAFDAQAFAVSVNGTPCSTTSAFSDPGCGCGPNMMWCTYGSQDLTIVRSFVEDLERRLRDMVESGGSYLDLFRSTRAYVNGPVVHFLRHLANFAGGIRVTPTPIPDSMLPDLEWSDTDTWIPIELPDHHAGVLTSPAFLLRFQTNRARANRFYNAFLCEAFAPPPSGIEISNDPNDALNPDVSLRPGCSYCHARLEPAASYWGRWGEQGAGYVDPEMHPAFREDCYECATTTFSCSDACTRFYTRTALSSQEVPYLGWLKAYTFREPAHHVNIEQGPELLVSRTIADNRLPACVARSTAEWLIGRELVEEEQPWVDGLAMELLASDFDYRDLVTAIVTSDVYRRVR